jgi:transcription elongation factor Elf1
MTFIPETHTCPWCNGQTWELKTMNQDEEPRLKCNECNAGFRVSTLPESLSDDRQMEVDA